jgi:hypothetical protein
LKSYADFACSAIATSARKISVAPLRRAFGRSPHNETRNGKSEKGRIRSMIHTKAIRLSPARGGWLVARNQTRKEV